MLSTTAALALLVSAPAADPVPLWDRWERAWTNNRDTHPLSFAVNFTSPSGKKVYAPGFWDGGRTWRVRFMPDEEGKWSYETEARPGVSAPGLIGHSGSFECRALKGVKNPLLRHGPVRVAKNGRHLEHADGTPFFWLGDTAWSGPALSARDDWATYLDDRAAKHFTVIQFNTLAPWRNAPTDAEGRTAYTGTKDVRINPDYFKRLDQRIDAINARGMVAAPVLIWALKDSDPGNALPEADVERLVRYQVARYGAHHVVWVLAGDNPYGRGSDRWRRIGRKVFDGSAVPVTTHPTGMNWPWESWRDEKWLTVLGYQSGHGDDANTLKWIHSGPPAQPQNGDKLPLRPVINLEPPYEDHLAYQSRKPHSAYSVRRACYWSLLNAPPVGVTYGAHGIWSWQTKPGEEPRDHKGTGVAKVWREAMKLPGSTHMKHLADLFTSLDWWALRPDQTVLAEQPGRDDPAKFVSAAWSGSEMIDLMVLYLPVGGTVTLNRGGGLRARWFDPRTGEWSRARRVGRSFTAPDTQDWVLVLDHA